MVFSPNTLVLQVDPSTGQAQIINPTRFDVNMDGYSITSESGSLDVSGTGWVPLADSDRDWAIGNPIHSVDKALGCHPRGGLYWVKVRRSTITRPRRLPE